MKGEDERVLVYMHWLGEKRGGRFRCHLISVAKLQVTRVGHQGAIWRDMSGTLGM